MYRLHGMSQLDEVVMEVPARLHYVYFHGVKAMQFTERQHLHVIEPRMLL